MKITDPNERNCYCGIWEKDPEFYRSRGVPEGFCGLCDVCQAPGHTRHAPDGPYTGTWCDKHYGSGRFSPLLARFLAFVVIGVAFLAVRRCL